MSAHTPGPWDYFVGNSDGRGLIRVETSASAPAAGVHVASLTRGATSEANARLIAAAPALLTALRHVSSCSRCAHDGWEDCPGGLDALATLVRAAP